MLCLVLQTVLAAAPPSLLNKLDALEVELLNQPSKVMDDAESLFRQLATEADPTLFVVKQRLLLLQAKANHNLGDLEQASTLAQSILAQAKRAKEPWLQASAYFLLGQISETNESLDQSLAYYKQAESLFKQTASSKALALVYTAMGSAYRHKAQYANALYALNQAMPLQTQLKDQLGLAQTHNLIGVVYDYMGNFESALVNHAQSLTLQKQSGNDAGIATSLYNIGEIYRDLGNYQLALEHFSQALEMDKQGGNPLHIANSHTKLGQVYLQLSKLGQARFHTKTALSLFEGLSSDQSIAWCLSVLAQITMAEGRLDQVSDLLKQALFHAELGNSTRSTHLAKVVQTELAVKRAEYPQALELIAQALALPELGRGSQAELLERQSFVYQKLGQYQQALQSYQAYKLVSDDMLDKISSQHVENLKQDVAFVQKEQQVKLLTKDKQLQQSKLEQFKLQRWLFVAVLLLVMMIAAVSYWRQRQKNQLARLKAQMMADAVERKNQLLADVSHELRTPLAVLKLNIEALQYNLESDPEQAYKKVHDKIGQLNTLIHDIYQSAQFDNNIVELVREPVDITELLDDMVQDFRPLAKQSSIKLNFKSPAQAIELDVDSERIKQVLVNLLRNSIRYTDSGGMTLISCKPERNHFSIRIDDTAPGLQNEAEYARIFERLYRGEASRNRDTGGSGLGLSICKQLMQAHGGDIQAMPSKLGGLRIELRLPFSVNEDVQESR